MFDLCHKIDGLTGDFNTAPDLTYQPALEANMAKSSIPLTIERLKTVFHYDLETGVFTNLVQRAQCYPGKIVGTQNQSGHLLIAIDGKRYLAHLLAWFYIYGYWPKSMIDHKNNIPQDNSWSNLRLANKSLNAANSKIRKDSSSGFKGVSWDRRRLKWRANIVVNGKQIYLGYFVEAEMAHQSYCKAAQKFYGEFANYGVSQ